MASNDKATLIKRLSGSSGRGHGANTGLGTSDIVVPKFPDLPTRLTDKTVVEFREQIDRWRESLQAQFPVPQQTSSTVTTDQINSAVSTYVDGINSALSDLKQRLSSIEGNNGSNADFLDGKDGSFYQDADNLVTGTLSADRLPAFSGDVTSSAGSSALVLAIITQAGTYKSVTVDSKGRVISGFNPTTLAGYGITDAIDTSSTGQTKNGSFSVKGVFGVQGPASFTGAVQCGGTLSAVGSIKENGDQVLHAGNFTSYCDPRYTRKYSTNVGDGYSTQYDIVHNLGTTDVVVSINRLLDNIIGNYATAIITYSTNVVRVTFASAPTTGQYRVTVIG